MWEVRDLQEYVIDAASLLQVILALFLVVLDKHPAFFLA